MKPFWRKWWFWALLAAVAVSLPYAVRYSKTGGPETPLPPEETGEVMEAPTAEWTEPPAETPTEDPTEAPTEAPAPTDAPAQAAVTYILNTNTKKFHYPDCGSVADMKEKNKQEYTGSREELIAEGYSPCGRCKP